MHKQALYKTLSWQTISATVATIVTWWWFGDIGESINFVVFEGLVFGVLYYIHEMIWRKRND